MQMVLDKTEHMLYLLTMPNALTIDSIMRPPHVPSDAETKAALRMTLAIAETIRELGELPSGTLYDVLCSKVDLAGYERILAILKGAGLITVSGHCLRWIGPMLEVRG